MRGLLRTLASILLLTNGAGAFYGSYHLVLYPDGSSLGMTMALLEHSPFTDFLIPGIILLLSNGIMSFVALLAFVYRKRSYPLLTMTEGTILFGWIVIQMLMLRQIAALHIIYGTIGFLLILIGWMLMRVESTHTVARSKITI